VADLLSTGLTNETCLVETTQSLGIDHLFGPHRFQQLSGGELQRLAIAATNSA
jgi:translation initiation factor RLI1